MSKLEHETGEHSGGSHCSEYIFEVVDVSNEESYFAIGVFLSLQEAVEAIEAKPEPWGLCESAMYSGDYACIEIRRRKMGIDPLNNGDVVWKRAWNNIYDEDADDNDWRIILPNVRDQGSAPTTTNAATKKDQSNE
jgi:hypothetical protein